MTTDPRFRPGRPSRRSLLGLGAAGLLGAGAPGLAGCARPPIPTGADDWTPDPTPTVEPDPSVEHPRLIGDGSTAYTGPQPGQPEARRLERGERPPQFVVASWDGAASLDDGLFSRFRKVAQDIGGSMTFFLSGLYLLPESRRDLYHPPGNPQGASDIGYLSDAAIRETLKQLRASWLEGHEIGTHFNGHFCGGPGSVEHWSPEDWRSEIDQAVAFVTQWRTNTGFDDLEPLPFDYTEELVGGRTPCLLGQENLLPTAADLGWRYDASSPGRHQTWPVRRGEVWDFPLQLLPFPGYSFEVLSMDYNILANQSGTTNGDPSQYARWREEARGTFVAGFERAYSSNRAPLFIGNHFEQWNGGIYMDAVEDALREMATHDEVRFVSFRQLCDWLEAQTPEVVENLRGLGVGQAPLGGWQSVVPA
ncbi:hypothetical protein GCM10009716_08320 [Streptomyces sodiiphilus]|uniref:Lipoprotein n=1 Tax=Streptomyces sodiiphilus TaxID=226217 RepID=A0ABP5A4V0_9ACTN